MFIKQFFPPQGLEEYVDYIWVVQSKNLPENKRQDIIMPLGHINIIFNYGSKYHLQDKDNTYLVPNAVLVGQIKNAKHVLYGPQLEQIGISLTPIGFLCLFAVDGIEVTEKIIDLNDINPSFFNLYDRKKEKENRSSFIDEIYTYIRERIKPSPNVIRLKAMIEYINQNIQNLKIEQMAEEFYISISALERFFKKNVGMTPKAYGNIMKFRKSIENEKRYKDMQKNYYDQSHLLKNTQKFSDKTLDELTHVKDELTLKHVVHPKVDK